MIPLIQPPGKVVGFLQQNRHPFITTLVVLGICVLFWLVVSSSVFTPATTSHAPVQRGDVLIASPIQSTGCGKSSSIAPGSSSSQTIFSGGITRSYLLHIPRVYHDTVGQPLILNFHGHGSSAFQQQHRTGFSILADTNDVIIAYPQGVVGPDHHTGWATGPRRNPGTNDVLFVSDLLNHLEATWCIDPHRIYATGFSNGGGMTNALACKLAGRIAAFASISGAYPSVPGGCHPARPVPFFELHGTGDTVVPYGGSLSKGYPPVPLWLRQWAERDHCASNPTIFFHQANIIGEKWMGCSDHVTIIHYLIGGMGHTWPRHIMIDARDATAIPNATTLIWAFFQDYPLPTETTHLLIRHSGG